MAVRTGARHHDGTDQEPWSVLAAFRRQAARGPEKTALVIGGETLTYRELDRASAGLARLLWRRGARPGRVVCVRVEPSALAVIAVLASLRTGAAWAAIEPDLPPSRVRQLLRDTDCAVILGEAPEPDPGDVTAPPAVLDAAGLTVAGLVEAGACTPDDWFPPVPEGTPAYLVHTSGSTGLPKGVMVSRAQLVASIGCRAEVYGTEPSTFLMAMRLSFDGMLGGMFWSFCNGHTLLLPGLRELRQVGELARLAAEHHATHLVVVPSYYRALLAESRLLPDTLRLVVVAGEECTPELVRTHHERLPGALLVNEYGPTETTISCVVQPGLDASWDRIPIGRPWPGALARVLDERLREVPAGELGELYIGGIFVALGYAGAPGRTAERFVADPFGPPGARLYRTGDLAVTDERGALHYRGRTDLQVKIRGIRVELGEIESVLENHPAVGQAVVNCERTDGDEPRLIAFVTPRAPGAPAPTGAELRRHCRGSLVEQAVPERFVPVARMPLNTSGKADRAALRDLLPTDVPTGSATDEAPAWRDWTRDQRTLGRIWAAVLRHSDIGLDDNFFAVGGSSLKVIDLHTRMNHEWPGVLRMGELFDLITISAQAAALHDRLGTGAGREAPALPTAYEL
ncbi:non-ribosomal peptide synthetase [Streptomyces syringium]|uniref:Amino acid adenylation domain-containing protein n=1 Tax=Streptomyces syringium TaxID=76729 RepID=A0ABS4YB17_9ACTN|nr:non-ribosomal peptide synthetase [Streptomyces syringium]MBP2405986.1 amino acid adenylation domain-containing protein [Streptomyces syringium]